MSTPNDNKRKENKMNSHAVFISSIATIVALIGALSAADSTTGVDQLTEFYEGCIHKYISRCQTKAALFVDSIFRNLRESGARAARKAEFFSRHKDLLINEMLAAEIGKKYYKVEMYLNKKFEEAQHAVDTAYSQVENIHP